MALPRPPPLPSHPPPIPSSSWSRPQGANLKPAAAAHATLSNLSNTSPTSTVKTSSVESHPCSWDQDQAFVPTQPHSLPLAAFQNISPSHQQRTASRPSNPQPSHDPPHSSAPPTSHSVVSHHLQERAHHLALSSQPIPAGSQSHLQQQHHHQLNQVVQPQQQQHYQPQQSQLYQPHPMQQQFHHHQLTQHQIQTHHRQQLQRQQHLGRQPVEQQLAIHRQTQALQLQPASQQHGQTAGQNQLHAALYRQHSQVADLHPSALNPSTAIQPSGLQPVPGTDVLSVADASQIGMSFAASAPSGQLDPYQQLPAGASRDYPNADFWHTVIDHNKQQQVAAAAAAAAAASSNPLRNAGGAPNVQLYPAPAPGSSGVGGPTVRVSGGSAGVVRATSGGASAPRRHSQITEPRIQKAMLTCDVCGRTFGQRGSLGRHKKAVHMGVRPFPCEICGFCFQQRYDLRKHVLSVHEHERPFACDVENCKAAFSRRAKLRKHVTTVHLKQRDFVCEVCNSAFGEKSNRTKHIRAVHLQERKYQCTICAAAFKERGHCTKHMLTQHNVQQSSTTARNDNSDVASTVAVPPQTGR